MNFLRKKLIQEISNLEIEKFRPGLSYLVQKNNGLD
jgi:hypothetical protein